MRKKNSRQGSPKAPEIKMPVAREGSPMHQSRHTPTVKAYNFDTFNKMAANTPFTMAEWAAILHLSERTLQRYAKNNSEFASINAERALQIEKVLREAKLAFGSTQKFYDWLKRNPTMIEGSLSLSSLHSYEGIESVLTQLGRIQHGLFA